MPAVVPATTCHKERVFGAEQRRGDLGLVADFGQKEGNGGGRERTVGGQLLVAFVKFVGLERPQRHGDEADSHHPAQDVRRQEARDLHAQPGRSRMVDQRGDEDAERDRPGLAEARGQQQGQQLGLVADFTEGDGSGGNQEGLHLKLRDRAFAWTRRQTPRRPIRSCAMPACGLARHSSLAPRRSCRVC
jgi:hypothetical protein